MTPSAISATSGATPPPLSACGNAGNCPSQNDAASAFDPIRDEIVSFGGGDPSGKPLDTTWVYKGGRWTQRQPHHVPPARTTGKMVFDAEDGLVVMYGGRDVPPSASSGGGGDIGQITYATDTWTWDGIDWAEQHPAHVPRMFVPDITFDYGQHNLVLVGIGAAGMETWIWARADWRHVFQADGNPQPPRHQVRLSYDPATDRVIYFGGFNQGSVDLSAVWSWDGKQWSSLPGTEAPPVYYFGPMAPDAGSKSMFIYNRSDTTTSTWKWNGTTFEELTTVHTPSLNRTSLFSDPQRGRVLLVGWTYPDRQFQLWAWSASDWTMTQL